MFGLWRAFGALLPLGLAGTGALIVMTLAWRRLGPRARSLTALGFLTVWSIGMAAVSLRPQPGWLDEHNVTRYRGFNPMPFSEIGDALTNCVTWHVAVEQLVGNLALFAPLGVGLAMVADARRARWLLGFAAGAAVGSIVEAAQWALAVGRVSSVDDVLLATAGSGIGFLIARPLVRVPRRLRRPPGGSPGSPSRTRAERTT